MSSHSYVDVVVKCPYCGDETTSFETKDIYPSPYLVSLSCVQHFYGDCQSCNKWLEFTHIRPATRTFLLHYSGRASESTHPTHTIFEEDLHGNYIR